MLLQMEAAECGAASLGIVLAHHGLHMTLEELRVACGVSRDGSNAGNIVKAARRLGMDAKGFKKEPQQLAEVALPAIIHWNFNHFLVLEGFVGDRVLLNDPAAGRRTVTRRELDQAFTGVVLQLSPGEGFEPRGRPPSILPALRERLQGTGAALLFAVLAGVGLVVPGLVLPAFVRVFVDDLLIGGAQDWLGPLLAGLALTAVARATLTWLREECLIRLETRLSVAQSSRFLWHVLRLPKRFFDARRAGDIAGRIGLNDRLASLLSGRLASTLLDLLTVVFFAALMFDYDAELAAIAVALAAANLLALRLAGRHRTEQGQALLHLRGKLDGVEAEGLQMVETLKATGGESDFFARWAGHHANVMDAEQRMAVSGYALSIVPGLLSGLGVAAVLGLGGVKVMAGGLSMGMLVAFQSLLASFMGPVRSLVALGAELQEVQGQLARIEDVLRHPPDTPFIESDEPPPPETVGRVLEGRVEIEGLTFGYSPLAPPLIEDLSLSLAPGARVALVGGSGSGKSTVVGLVAGMYEPWGGEIRLDGVQASRWPWRSRTRGVGLVDQQVFLFEGTVRDNLTLWDPTVPDADVVRAARDACIHEVISHRPGGYDAVVQEGGRNFSGGQRQRLEIARALATNPAVLLLDEATSALDPLTERTVDDALRRRGCSCIIVAHRLSTVRDADEIVVLHRGQVVQRGTHDQLKGAGGRYAELLGSAGAA